MSETTIQNDLIARPLKLAELATYQGHSIVSREIIKKPVGTVTVFAFDQGQGLSEHTAPFDAMVNVIEGEAEIMISGKAHTVKEGEFIIMPANQPHAVQAQKRFKMMLVMVRG